MRAPARVSERGPLMAAIVTVRSWRAINARASSSPRPTASIVPSPRAQPSMKRARSTMIRAPSSRLNTPATQAAAISPTLCPTIAAGSMPHDFHSSASATCIAKIAGCAISVRCICEVSSVRAEFLEQGKARPRSHRGVAAFDGLRGRPARGASTRGPCPTIAGPVRSSRRRCAAALRGAE